MITVAHHLFEYGNPTLLLHALSLRERPARPARWPAADGAGHPAARLPCDQRRGGRAVSGRADAGREHREQHQRLVFLAPTGGPHRRGSLGPGGRADTTRIAPERLERLAAAVQPGPRPAPR